MIWIWVFNGVGATFPSGVFSTQQRGEEWIRKHALSGTLSAYPLDSGVYEWAVENGTLDPAKVFTSRGIGSFSSAYAPHFHYEEGVRHGIPADA